jgi:hypothetical protein
VDRTVRLKGYQSAMHALPATKYSRAGQLTVAVLRSPAVSGPPVLEPQALVSGQPNGKPPGPKATTLSPEDTERTVRAAVLSRPVRRSRKWRRSDRGEGEKSKEARHRQGRSLEDWCEIQRGLGSSSGDRRGGIRSLEATNRERLLLFGLHTLAPARFYTALSWPQVSRTQRKFQFGVANSQNQEWYRTRSARFLGLTTPSSLYAKDSC